MTCGDAYCDRWRVLTNPKPKPPLPNQAKMMYPQVNVFFEKYHFRADEQRLSRAIAAAFCALIPGRQKGCPLHFAQFRPRQTLGKAPNIRAGS